MNIENKFFDRKRGRAEILRVMDYYIDINNIAYIDSIEKEKRENDNQISEDEITKKEWWQKIWYLWYINEANKVALCLYLFL